MTRLIVSAAIILGVLPATARAALPPLSPDELKDRAEVVVTGKVDEALTTIERKKSSSIYVVNLTVTIETVEKGERTVSPGKTMEIRCWRIRKSRMVGPAGHGPIPAKGSRFRMWLRKDSKGYWEPLEPNGIELLEPAKEISFGNVEKRRVRNALIVSVPVALGIAGVLVAQYGRKRN